MARGRQQLDAVEANIMRVAPCALDDKPELAAYVSRGITTNVEVALTDEASLRAGDAQCSANGSCKPISGVGVCTYDK